VSAKSGEPHLEHQTGPRPRRLTEAFAYRYLSIAQRYAEVRKGMGLKFVGYAADSILQMLVAKINQEAEVLYVPLRET
jgi:hypothetical protein